MKHFDPHSDNDCRSLQIEIIAYMQSPAAYSHVVPDQIDVIDTHCAYLILAGDFVYKIKRAVTYSYLDMSSLETRKALCEREYEINHVSLPHVYIGVIPITREIDGNLAIDGGGVPVEWALRMHRFEENKVLDNIATSGELTSKLAQDTGRSIAVYHLDQAALNVVDGFDRISEVVHELITEMEIVGQIFDPIALKEFRDRGLRELELHEDLLDQRALDGYIKRCHGDLHLRNILLSEERPLPFDALEFDERMATTDVLYDLAFLLMDLDHRGLHEQKNVLLNEYLLRSDMANYGALTLMPLFLFCRAGIKAMTSAQAADTNDNNNNDLIHEAREYLELALSYIKKHTPIVIAVGGLSGSGKSTIAKKLATTLNAASGIVLIRSDSERKAALSLGETERIPNEQYTAETSLENYKLLLEKTGLAINAGYSVIVDAVFLDDSLRRTISELVDVHNVPFYGFWLEAPTEELEARINRRIEDASDATVSVLHKQQRQLTGRIRWTKIDAGRDLEAVCGKIVSHLPSDSLRVAGDNVVV